MIKLEELIKSIEVKSPCCQSEMEIIVGTRIKYNKENDSLTTNTEIKPVYGCLNCGKLYTAETNFNLADNIKVIKSAIVYI